jgi:hypothetical protein
MSHLLSAQGESVTTRTFDVQALTALVLADLGLNPETSTVEFEVATRSMGYGMAERDEKVFIGAKVTTRLSAREPIRLSHSR